MTRLVGAIAWAAAAAPPQPGGADTLLVDLRETLQEAENRDEAAALLSETPGGGWDFALDFGGQGLRAFMRPIEWTPDEGDAARGGLVFAFDRDGNDAAPREVYVQWKQWLVAGSAGEGDAESPEASTVPPSALLHGWGPAWDADSQSTRTFTGRLRGAPALFTFSAKDNMGASLMSGAHDASDLTNRELTFTFRILAETGWMGGNGIVEMWVHHGGERIEHLTTDGDTGVRSIAGVSIPGAMVPGGAGAYVWDVAAWTPGSR